VGPRHGPDRPLFIHAVVQRVSPSTSVATSGKGGGGGESGGKKKRGRKKMRARGFFFFLVWFIFIYTVAVDEGAKEGI